VTKIRIPLEDGRSVVVEDYVDSTNKQDAAGASSNDEETIDYSLYKDLIDDELLDSMIPEGEVGYSEDEAFLSEEGSKDNKHSDKPIIWKGYPGMTLLYECRKSALYIKSARDLKMHLTELASIENNVLDRIRRNLNGGFIHGSIHKGKICECDFGGRDVARLLYLVDTNPPAIYFGYVFKRSEMGHVSDKLAQAVLEYVLKERAIYIAELEQEKENERRKNRRR
jgi:hypothetical protein